MFAKSAILLASISYFGLAAADFVIYYGGSNSVSEGGSSTYTEIKMFNGEPSCDDVNNAQPLENPRNDASSSGWACDGCSDPIDSANIARFEWYNAGGPVAGPDGHYSKISLRCTSLPQKIR